MITPNSALPPPQPPDLPHTRPEFDLQSMILQVNKIQSFLKKEREK